MDGCRIGFGRIEITPDRSGATSGWGPLGRKDAAAPDEADQRLFVTALALEDARGQRVVMANADLMCGGAALWRAIATAVDLSPSAVVLCGTHTHAGPGQRFGGRMYSLFSTPSPLTVARSTRRLAPLVSKAARNALDTMEPGGVAVVRAAVRGTGSNRAVPAWSHYDDDQRSGFLTSGPGSLLSDDEPEPDRLRDPRVTALVAGTDDGTVRCVLAWHAVHGTSLGASWPTFGADLWGVARVEAEDGLDGAVVGFGGGSSGDISPLPIDSRGERRDSSTSDRPIHSGRELAETVGRRLGQAIRVLVPTATPTSFSLDVAHEMWDLRHSGLPSPLNGLASAGGGLDGQTDLWQQVRAGIHAPRYRAMRHRAHAMTDGQGPKIGMVAAYTRIPVPIGFLFRLLAPRRLPIHVVRLGGHAFATVPGEPTTMTGWRIEQAVEAVVGADSVSVVGFAGDYCGYWVSPEEYLEQRYEASSTIFGREASTRLIQRLTALAGSLPPRPS